MDHRRSYKPVLRKHVWDSWAGDIGLRSPPPWTDLGCGSLTFSELKFPHIQNGNNKGAGPIFLPLSW